MTEIKIKDLRGVGDVELNLDDSKRVFVFFGSNGVGKTKTLESLFYLYLAQTVSFSATGYSLKIENKVFESITLNRLTLETQKTLLNKTDSYLPKFFEQIDIKNFDAIAYLGVKQRGSAKKDPTNHTKPMGRASERQLAVSQEISNALAENKLSELGMNQDIYHWFTERAKSVNPYQKQEDNRKVDIDTVLKALNILDERIEQTIQIDAQDNIYLKVEGQERELSELSSGFISVVKIIQSIISAYSAFTNATDLLNVKGVVLIDEIESHLHIEWQTKIVPTLKNLFPNTTFYIATHSPLVLSQLAEGEAYLLKRDADGVVRSEKINSPNTRLLANVLQDTFGVDLNTLKRDNMANIDQSQAKQRLLDLLNSEAQP
jgi:predicted ATP-binding protein involved in virulence